MVLFVILNTVMKPSLAQRLQKLGILDLHLFFSRVGTRVIKLIWVFGSELTTHCQKPKSIFLLPILPTISNKFSRLICGIPFISSLFLLFHWTLTYDSCSNVLKRFWMEFTFSYTFDARLDMLQFRVHIVLGDNGGRIVEEDLHLIQRHVCFLSSSFLYPDCYASAMIVQFSIAYCATSNASVVTVIRNLQGTSNLKL